MPRRRKVNSCLGMGTNTVSRLLKVLGELSVLKSAPKDGPVDVTFRWKGHD